jgi:hypothetical protein
VIGKLEDIYLSLVIIVGILIGSVLLSIILPDDDDDIDENSLHIVGSTGTDN